MEKDNLNAIPDNVEEEMSDSKRYGVDTVYRDCVNLLLVWSALEYQKNKKELLYKLSNGEERLPFVASIIVNKLKGFNIDINIPDPCLLLIEACSGSNPGFGQVMFKYLLEHISNHLGTKIPAGYTITVKDFATCFDEFPIIASNKEIYDCFEKLYLRQKRKRLTNHDSDNTMDYSEYWYDVCEHKE